MAIRNVVVVFFYDKDKKILLQHRDNNTERWPGAWSLFGGGMEEGESPEQAVKREMIEELSYELRDPKLSWQEDFKGKYYDGTRYVYIEEYDPSQKLVLGEGQGMGWYTPEEAEKLGVVTHHMDIIKRMEGKY